MKGKTLLSRTFLILFLLCSTVSPVWAAAPQRIVSLAPSVTEILFDLGLANRVVGVTNYCDQPPQARSKSRIGGYANPSLESIVALRPDLVIISREKSAGYIGERLTKLGIRTYIFKAQHLSELPSSIRELGRYLDIPETAEKKAKAMEKAMERFKRQAGKRHTTSRNLRALFIIHAEPLMVAGPGTVIDEALRILGLQNIAGKATMMYPKYSVEDVIKQSPDIIFVGTGYMVTTLPAGLLKKLDSLEAVKKKRVYLVSEALYRLGPRTVSGMEEIAGYLHKR